MKVPAPLSWPKYPNIATWLNQVRECIIASELKPSPNTKVRRTTGGTYVAHVQSRGGSSIGGSSTPSSCPFDITLTPQAGPSTHFDLTIAAGTVNSEVPASILSVVDYDPATTIFVKAHCLTDGKSVTSSSIVVDTSAPAINVANASSGTSTLDICIAVVSGGVVQKTLGWCGSITVTLEEVFLEDKVSPSIGESPYIRWYQWSIIAG
jgi:hypothetical protein